MRIFDDLMLNYSGRLIGIGAVGIFALLAFHQYRGVTRRRRRFRSRPSLTEEEWFAAFYPTSQDDRRGVREVLQAIADDIGIEWTRLRPTDTFEASLRVDRRYSPYDDLEEAELRIVAYAEKLGIANKALPGFTGALKDFLDRWVILTGGNTPGKQAEAVY